MTIKARSNQNLIDIALQEYGSVEGLVDLAMRNGKSITDLLQIGETLQLGEPTNADIVKFYADKEIKVATGAEAYYPPISTAYLIGNGLYFDGVNDYVQLPASFLTLLQNNVQGDKDFSFALWIRINSSYSNSYGQGVIIKALNNSNFDGTTKGFTFGSFDPNTITAGLVNVGSSNFLGLGVTKTLSTGLHHVIFTQKAGGTSRIYIDGILEGLRAYQAITNINYSGIDPRLGEYFGNSIFYQKGGLFDLKIFNKELDLDEVALLYNSQMPNSSAPSLIFNMPFEILQKPGSDILTPELKASINGTLTGYPTGAKGIVDLNNNDIQLIP